MILMASLEASAVPPPGPAAVEVVGGVEAAVEPAQDVPKGKSKEDLSLGPGDSILRDIGQRGTVAHSPVWLSTSIRL